MSGFHSVIASMIAVVIAKGERWYRVSALLSGTINDEALASGEERERYHSGAARVLISRRPTG